MKYTKLLSFCLIIFMSSISIAETYTFTKSDCDAGDMRGCHNVASDYYKKKNYKQALKYWKKACDGNLTQGCIGVGRLYFEGKGVQKNHNEAAQYYEKACNLDDAKSCKIVGGLYSPHYSDTVKTKSRNALKYMQKACNLGDNKACKAIKNDIFLSTFAAIEEACNQDKTECNQFEEIDKAINQKNDKAMNKKKLKKK